MTEIKKITSTEDLSSSSENIFRLQPALDLVCGESQTRDFQAHYREAVCDLCEKTVSVALGVCLQDLKAKTRCCAEIALARQIAMYLCHTTFSVLLTEIGIHFDRDRTTVAHACGTVENRRDDAVFDLTIAQLEDLLSDAKQAMSICVQHTELESALENNSKRKPHRQPSAPRLLSNVRGIQ